MLRLVGSELASNRNEIGMLEKARIELKTAQSNLSKTSDDLDPRQFLNLLWLTQSKLEYAILLLKLSSSLDFPGIVGLFIKPTKNKAQIIIQAQTKINCALYALDLGDVRSAVQNARLARDLLRQTCVEIKRKRHS